MGLPNDTNQHSHVLDRLILEHDNHITYLDPCVPSRAVSTRKIGHHRTPCGFHAQPGRQFLTDVFQRNTEPSSRDPAIFLQSLINVLCHVTWHGKTDPLVGLSHDRRIDANQVLNDAIVNQEIQRLEAIAEKEREYQEKRLAEGVISEIEYNEAIQTVNDEFRTAKAELETQLKEQKAQAAVIDLENERAVRQEQAGGLTGYGRDDVEKFWMNLRSSFPDAKFTLEHCANLQENKQTNKSAIRWSLIGKHSGSGLFGAPTHTEVYVMGINHAEFSSKGVKNEWVLFDETAVWKQILLKTG